MPHVATASRLRTLALAALTSFGLAALPLAAQSSSHGPASRLAGSIGSSARVTLEGSHSPLTRIATDQGALNPSTPLSGMTLVFSRSAAQAAALDQLLAAQQNPASTLYHQWLTPQQFGTTFGMSDADLAATTAWLQQQGLSVDAVSPSRDRITFSGTAAQVETAFGAPLHNFALNGETHFAPTADLTLPAALAGITAHIDNLSSFHPHSHLRNARKVSAPTAHFTSSQSGSHYLTPGDIRTIYDINPAYNAGYTGSGQSIAIVGQSAIVALDIEHFQTASGVAVHDPTQILIPNSGVSTVYSDDESESDLDLEYASTIAPGATIKFVYSGNNANASVTDALTYAVQHNVAPIISSSYGQCEASLAAGAYATQNAILQQAAAQGQTVVSASGDDGSSDCAESSLTGLSVDYPASSQYVTGMGGTEFPAASVAAGNNTYFAAETSTDIVSSALSYIPEVVWNDSNTAGISAGGGGASSLTARPTWQAGVTGIPSGSYRLVPDVSLDSSPSNASLLYCSSDYNATQITGSCTNGFRDSSNVYLTVAGGTSFAAPIFAGMVALINQSQGYTTGQGLLNPTLYTLAANPVTYASAFHDITSGNNACVLGYQYCSAAADSSYAATTGYDEATGLGSLDLYNLLRLWSSATATTTSGLTTTSTTIAAATITPAAGVADTLTITVAAGTAVPSGTLTVIVDGTTQTNSLALTNGIATYSFTSPTSGTHLVTATYAGNSTYAASTTSITLTVPSTTTSASSFTVAATNVTVAAGSSGTSTVTVTPANAYNGTVAWSLSSASTLTNACYSIASLSVTGTTAVTTTLTLNTSASACTTLTALQTTGGKAAAWHRIGNTGTAAAHQPTRPGSAPFTPTEQAALATLFCFGLAGLRSRRIRPLAAILVVAGFGVVLSGCGSGATTSLTTNASTGTYALTLTGTDTASSTFTAHTTLTLVVQ